MIRVVLVDDQAVVRAGDAEVVRQLRGVVLGREPSVGAGRAIQQVGDEAVADGPLREYA